MNNELIKEIYNLKAEKAKIEEEMEKSKERLKVLTELIDERSDSLLYDMLNENVDYTENDNIVAKRMARKSIKYSNEQDILADLKENYEGKFIRTKTTETLDKMGFKKAIKNDKEFSEKMSKYICTTDEPFVVVTSKENYNLMMEHLNKNSDD